ncbi:hypothetical protein [Stenotrophomonas geniculata]|uniref:hypothetical protein n=1 Tax=Stenotrophomonas geniculata TaxID=86188 RepID=UPI0024790E67|nr:hypothetical protein [Stenotrophomonas geniculata]MDH7548242.1 hypothetical protein [Stenotrophomonas geniculata]
MKHFERLDAAFAEQFGALPPITPPVSPTEAREAHNREAVEGLCVEESNDEH